MFPCSFIISMAFKPFVLDNSKKVMVLTDRFINDTTKRLVLFIKPCSIHFLLLMWRRNSGLHHLLIFGSPSQCSTMFRGRLVKVIKRYFYLFVHVGHILSIQATGWFLDSTEKVRSQQVYFVSNLILNFPIAASLPSSQILVILSNCVIDFNDEF